MIFRKEILSKIEKGEVSIAFRQWKKLSITEGKTLKTSVGLILFKKITVVKLDALTKSDAIKAGLDSLEALVKDLSGEGTIYKITFSLTGPDPRLKLREEKSFSADDKEALLKKLKPTWVLPVLTYLSKNEGTPSKVMADELGYEQMKLKLNVRKLKNLGLTISLGTGYKLSPRGKVVLKLIQKS